MQSYLMILISKKQLLEKINNMTDFINPISQVAGYAMKAATLKLRDAGERLATGDRGKANIVD